MICKICEICTSIEISTATMGMEESEAKHFALGSSMIWCKIP